eukprot:3564194-Ditylum_brightwellii.AAC.1
MGWRRLLYWMKEKGQGDKLSSGLHQAGGPAIDVVDDPPKVFFKKLPPCNPAFVRGCFLIWPFNAWTGAL